MSRVAGVLIGGLIGLVVSSTIMYLALHSSFYTEKQALNSDPEKGRRRVRVAVVVMILILTVFGALFGLALSNLPPP